MTGATIALRLAQLTVEDGARRSVHGSGAVQTNEIRRGPGRGQLTVLVECNDLQVASRVAARIRIAYSRALFTAPLDDLIAAVQAGEADPDEGPRYDSDTIEGTIATLFRDGYLYFAVTGGARLFLLRQGRVLPLVTQSSGWKFGQQSIEVGQQAVSSGETVALVGRACHPKLLQMLPDSQEEWGAAAGLLQVFQDNRRAFPPDITMATLTAGEVEAPIPQEHHRVAQRPRTRRPPDEAPPAEEAGTEEAPTEESHLDHSWEIWRRQPWMIPAVVVLLVIAGIAVYTVREMTSPCQLGPLLFTAEAREAEAIRATDPAAKHRLLSTAILPASQAAACDPADYGAQSTLKRIRDQLNELDNAVTSPWAATQVIVSKTILQIVLQGDTLYLLDAAQGAVTYRTISGRSLATASPDAVLVRRDDRAGSVVASDPVAIAWLPEGGARRSAGLAILDQNGLLFEHEPGQRMAVTTMRAGANWAKVASFGAYAGALFVLDPQSRDILWYPSTPNGYVGPPYRYLDQTTKLDLSTAQQILVDEDILVLLANGQVKRFQAGREVPFDLNTPEGPITKAARLHARDQWIFVAEAATHRIVQFDRRGSFVQQWRYDSAEDLFTGLRDFAVDRKTRRVVIVNQRGVFFLEWPDKG